MRSVAIAALIAAAGTNAALGQTAHWVAPGSTGTWADPQNWSGGLVPGNGAPGSPTVAAIDRVSALPYESVLDTSASLASVQITGPFATLRHTAGTLATPSLLLDGGAYQLVGGTISGATINSSNGGRLLLGADSGPVPFSTLVGTTVNAPTTMLGGEVRLDFTSSLLGGVTLPNGGLFTYTASGVVRGNMTLDAGDNDQASIRLRSATGSSISVASGVTISGRTSIATEGPIFNNGTLVATDTGTGSLSAALFGVNSTFGQVSNNGTMHADGAFFNVVGTAFTQTSAGRLIVENNSQASIYTGTGQGGTTYTINGQVEVTGNSTLSISGRGSSAFLSDLTLTPGSTLYLAGRLDNAGRTINFTPTMGRIDGTGGVINGGTINIQPGAQAPLHTLLDGVTVNAAELVLDSSMQLQGASVINAPLIRIGTGTPAGEEGGQLFIFPGTNFALDGRDAILDHGELSGADDWTLHIASGNRLVGRNGVMRSLLSNDGLVIDDTGTGTMILGLPQAVGDSYNRGTIRTAVPGASIIASNIRNEATGLVEAGPGSQLWLTNRFTNSGLMRSDGGTLVLDAPMARSALGQLQQINGGDFVIADRFELEGSTLAFDGSTNVWRLAGTITNGAIDLPAGVPMIVSTLDRSGSPLINLSSAPASLENVAVHGDLAVQGMAFNLQNSTVSGHIRVATGNHPTGDFFRIYGNTPDAQGRTPIDVRVTSANQQTYTFLFGSGNTDANSSVNLAPTFSFNGAGSLTLPGNAALPSINRGLITADAPSQTLYFGTGTSASFTNLGTATARSSGRLTIGPVTNGAGGVIGVEPGSETWLTLGGPNTGTLAVNGGHMRLLGTFPTASIGAVTRDAAAPGRFTIGGTVTNSGTFRTSDFGGPVELTGGTISGGTVTVSPGFPLIVAPLTGSGINQYGNGVISGATVNGQVTLNGVLDVINGAVLTTPQQTTTAGGALRYNGGTINGLNYTIEPVANVTPQTRSAFYTNGTTTLGATSLISGAGGRLTGGVFTVQGTLRADRAAAPGLSNVLLTQFTRIQNNGTFQAINGGTLRIDYVPQSPSNYILGNLVNGTLTGGTWRVGADSTLNLGGRTVTTSAAGTTIELSGLNAAFPALNTLQSNAGTLSLLTGAVLSLPGNLTNTGTLLLDEGRLTLGGAFNLGTGTPRGTLSTRNLAPGELAPLAASTAALSGTLNATVDPAWLPAIGARFLVISAPSGLTGQFTTINVTGLPAGWSVTAAYGATQMELVAVPTPGVTTLAAAALLGLRRRRPGRH